MSVDANGRTLNLITAGLPAPHVGGCCIGDILRVIGVWPADSLLGEEAKRARCPGHEPGRVPALVGDMESPKRLPRAA